MTLPYLYRWSQQRQAFGKPLSSQAVIRSKLAQMIARVESAQNWLENVTHQMNNVRPQLIPSFFGRFLIYFFPVVSRCHTTSSRRISLDRLLSSSSKPLTSRIQDSDRVFLVAGMLQTQGVLPQKTQRKYLVDDPSHKLAWASWLRTCVIRTLPFIFRCTMLSENFRFSTIVRHRMTQSWVVQRMLWAILVYDRH
jgi:hypothetical protein